MGEKVVDKVEFYDILGVLVPGVLLIAWLPVCFPTITSTATVKFSDAFAAIVLVALAFFAGYMVQALGSLIEPALCRLWRGKHSDRVFCEGNPCLKPGPSARIRAKLASRPGVASDNDGALYQYAAVLAETATGSRVTRFNGLYAFHRAILVLLLLVAVTLPFSRRAGLASGWTTAAWVTAVVMMLALLALVFNRTRERSIYYVREVVLTAERLIDALPTPAPPVAETHAPAPPAPTPAPPNAQNLPGKMNS